MVNYLRVRGEYIATTLTAFETTELPPRTRRIQHIFYQFLHLEGTTSAYAENTTTAPATSATQRNYLRVRGEY